MAPILKPSSRLDRVILTFIHVCITNSSFGYIHVHCIVRVDFQSTEWLLEDEADSLQDESAAKAYEVH